jgi:hypothetical protein
VAENAHALAARYNANCTRDDIEWFVDRNGNLRLRDRVEWSARNRHHAELRAEQQRREWMRNNDEGRFDQPIPINETLDL